MIVAVSGLGKIGLPLAATFAAAGHLVVGVDINPTIVGVINSGGHLKLSEPQIPEMVNSAVRSGKLRATVDYRDAVSLADVVVIVVPLVLDFNSQPNFSSLDLATQNVGVSIKKGAVVIFETTLPVGTTRNRLTPILEEQSGMHAGSDFFVAYSPERVYSGQIVENLKQYPKLVGGINSASARAAVDFYESTLEFNDRTDLARKNGVWDLGSSEAAELAKLAETTYRDVNIALANQFARHAEQIGVDIYSVIDACNSQPFSHIHRPGVAVGGHCIPVYPELYLAGDPSASIVSESRKVNLEMPHYALQILERDMGSLDGKRIAILGLSYRGGVKEAAYSGAWTLVSKLKEMGSEPVVHDPLYSDSELENYGLTPFEIGQSIDGVVIQTDHDIYRDLKETDFPGVHAVFDGRRILDPKNFTKAKLSVVGDGSLAQ
jgi:nucleotide sugar dehydrogenase